MTISAAFLMLLAILLLSFIIFWLIGEHGKPLRLSTWRFMKIAGIWKNLTFSTLHAYVYARWLREYVGFLRKKIIPNISPKGRQWWADHYHGKIISTESANAIINLDKKISIEDLEQVIPYQTARSLILDGPPDVVVFNCACRGSAENPCEPIKVCMVIGKPFSDFILEHHPKTARRFSQQEALDLLQAEHERGHFHSAWFKDVMLDRFYAICNCCSCCCAALEGMKKYGTPFLSSSGYVVKVDEDTCEGCGTCGDICHFEAINVNGNAEIKLEKCMGCGVCVDQCPTQSLSLQRDESKGIPLDVRLLPTN
jgi:ferredoxin